ncbi:MAG TPA: hypothetical protein ENN30_01180 [Candidatus Woesearchaeota archaeon]|nr:hypothetical protein [Candidatus Woesearchaeota archaeon]
MKKGQTLAMKNIVAGVVAIVFVIVVIYMLMGSGVMKAYYQGYYGFIRTFSAHIRGVLVSSMYWLWQRTAAIMMVSQALMAAAAGAGEGATYAVESGATTWQAILKTVGIGAAKSAAISTAKTGLFAMLGYALLVEKLFAVIPLIAPVTEVDIGLGAPADPIDVYSSIASNSLDCYNHFGAGLLDPLWGVDPPNPRTCVVLKAESKELIDPKGVLQVGSGLFDSKWTLGYDEPNIYLFCRDLTGKGELIRYGNDEDSWGGCSFKKATVFIMYADIHPLDLFSYGTGVCRDVYGDSIKWRDISRLDRDAIVWCIQVEEK